MINVIITCTLVILIAMFGLLKTIWGGFIYFALSALVVLFVYWLIILIKSYIITFHKNIDERYKIYCANIVNSSSITLQEIESKNQIYFNQFKKSLRKEKLLEIAKMLLVASLLVICVGLFFSGKLI